MRRQIFLPILNEHPYFCFPESVGHYKDDAQHKVNRKKGESPTFNLHIIIAGKGYLESDGITYTLSAGDAFLYFPHESQCYYSDEDEPWEVLWVHFSGICLKEFLIENGFLSTHCWTLKSSNNIKGLVFSLLEEAENFTILNPSTLSTLNYGVISELIAHAIPLTPNKGFYLYERIIALLPKMRTNLQKPFELKYWADELDISTFYFCKIFKKAVGMSPSRFIMLCRLQKAKQLLIENTHMSVKQVSLEVGYPSISYFGRLFLENEGVSPGDYRKRLAINNTEVL